jgi:hypothetical protein
MASANSQSEYGRGLNGRVDVSLSRRLLAVSVSLFVLGLPSAAFAQIANNCDASLWGHVYHPARLTQIHPCIRVTGTIVLERPEKDGDIHIRLKPDKQFMALLNAKNKSRQAGDLVLEPICVNIPTQADAIQPCRGLTNHVVIPSLGAHVAVTGTYVDDVEPNHGWMEIHPVTLIEAN